MLTRLIDFLVVIQLLLTYRILSLIYSNKPTHEPMYEYIDPYQDNYDWARNRSSKEE